MLKINQKQMEAFERAMIAAGCDRFVGWAVGYANILGAHDQRRLQAAFHDSLEDADGSGIDTEQRRFLFAAARLLMPQMSAMQYLRVMDLVFEDNDESDALRRIIGVRATTN